MEIKSEKARLFVAIDLDHNIKTALRNLQQRYLKSGFKGRYEDIENLHITLAFIGETDRIADIVKAVSSIQFEPFEIETTQIGRFKTRHGCDLLWMGLSNGDKLESLSNNVREALKTIDVSYSSTQFIPHITLVKDTCGWPGYDMQPAKMFVRKISVMETVSINGRRKYITK